MYFWSKVSKTSKATTCLRALWETVGTKVWFKCSLPGSERNGVTCRQNGVNYRQNGVNRNTDIFSHSSELGQGFMSKTVAVYAECRGCTLSRLCSNRHWGQQEWSIVVHQRASRMERHMMGRDMQLSLVDVRLYLELRPTYSWLRTVILTLGSFVILFKTLAVLLRLPHRQHSWYPSYPPVSHIPDNSHNFDVMAQWGQTW